MLKKVMAATAVTASAVGMVGALAPAANAIGDDHGTTSKSGNGASEAFGNSDTHGDMSLQGSIAQGTLNKPCIGLPAKVNAGAIVGIFVPVAVQDIPVLSAPQNQQCTENATQAKGDEPASHILDDISALSGNGAGNG
ncbi:rodlin [Streptomyces sp. NRRL B-1347]|uniref:rodlin n=1 Tax=Streptomyces sp. NRRL B-1347 TaxID=1476877 RepID=UPI0004C6559B|nr:rodlin [Streptomyces sp. NRRL B-1347]